MATNCLFFVLVSLLAFVKNMDCRSIVSSSLNEPLPRRTETLGVTKQEFFDDSSSVPNGFTDYWKNLTKFDDEPVGKGDLFDNVKLQNFVVTQGLNLEKILANLAGKTVDFKKHEERAAQWLELLEKMLQSLLSGKINENTSQTERSINDMDEIETILMDGDKKFFSNSGNNWIGNILEFIDEYDIDGRSNDDNESHVKSRYDDSYSSVRDNFETTKDFDKSGEEGLEQLDNMLVGVRNEIDRIRRYFEKLCRKHHSTPSTTWHVDDHDHDQRSNIIERKILSES